METALGIKTFITWHPPTESVTIGKIKVSAGKEAVITTKTTNSDGRSSRATVNIEYLNLEQGELSRWVLFHAFVIGDPWTIPSYMGTIYGVVSLTDKISGSKKDYNDLLSTMYRTEGTYQKTSYAELYDRFILLSEQQSGMVKNLLLDLKPGSQWSHSEMADYSYWRMVIDYSIIDAIIGQQPFCNKTDQCPTCNKTQIQHYPISAHKWLEGRLLEIIGDAQKASQYMKIIWTVRQSIRHKTAHQSDYPHQRPSSPLQRGVNEFDIDTAVNNFKIDSHALNALKDNMHEVTRILLLDDILQTKVFPDIRPYMIQSGGMSYEEFMRLIDRNK